MSMVNCKQCGRWLAHDDAEATRINEEYPFCDECIGEANETEARDNSQFGAGA